ncbi:MAG: GFA family protein [Rhodobacteraceae bacterium]|nr:GFA family protein [Paracoccaceae bacterium]
MYEGGCLWGAMRYRVEGELRPVIACHCQQCRRTSGKYVTATSCVRNAIETTGDVSWYKSSDDARRGFCPTCGSQLFWNGPDAHLSIMAGTLDDATGLSIGAHIFCADKGAYCEITDGLPQAPADDAVMTTQVPL